MTTVKNKLIFGLTYYEFGAISFLVIIYLVGIFGIGQKLAPQIVSLTPINLILSILTISFFHQGKRSPFLRFFALAFLIGFGVEVLGVQTGVIFGDYSYGPVLGPKILDTPLMIGVNWAMLIYAIGSTINLFFPKWKIFFKCIYGTICMVILDFLIEPVAIILDFWSWENEVIPLQNYLAWGIIAFGLFYLFFQRFKWESNKVAYALFILQCAFFGLLNLFLNT